jgi:hypothetical protein
MASSPFAVFSTLILKPGGLFVVSFENVGLEIFLLGFAGEMKKKVFCKRLSFSG